MDMHIAFENIRGRSDHLGPRGHFGGRGGHFDGRGGGRGGRGGRGMPFGHSHGHHGTYGHGHENGHRHFPAGPFDDLGDFMPPDFGGVFGRFGPPMPPSFSPAGPPPPFAMPGHVPPCAPAAFPDGRDNSPPPFPPGLGYDHSFRGHHRGRGRHHPFGRHGIFFPLEHASGFPQGFPGGVDPNEFFRAEHPSGRWGRRHGHGCDVCADPQCAHASPFVSRDGGQRETSKTDGDPGEPQAECPDSANATTSDESNGPRSGLPHRGRWASRGRGEFENRGQRHHFHGFDHHRRRHHHHHGIGPHHGLGPRGFGHYHSFGRPPFDLFFGHHHRRHLHDHHRGFERATLGDPRLRAVIDGYRRERSGLRERVALMRRSISAPNLRIPEQVVRDMSPSVSSTSTLSDLEDMYASPPPEGAEEVRDASIAPAEEPPRSPSVEDDDDDIPEDTELVEYVDEEY